MLLPLTHQDTLSLARERARAELRCGVGCAVAQRGFFFPAEYVDEQSWRILAAQKPVLIISAARAAMLGLPAVVSAIDASEMSLAALWNVIAGLTPAAVSGSAASDDHAQMLALAKQAGIIPAVLWFTDEVASHDAFTLSVEALHHTPELALVEGTSAALPIEAAPESRIVSFRTKFGNEVHLALIIGDMSRGVPLVRVHSSCVTGDVLGSLRCDCGDQLKHALAAMKQEGAGILLYLNQEGRNIGITNKLRAYALQEQGMDTFTANQLLGFEEDERDFSVAAAMLGILGITTIRLLTNNPDKMTSFNDSAIRITERVPIIAARNDHNHAYIEAKHTKRGHFTA